MSLVLQAFHHVLIYLLVYLESVVLVIFCGHVDIASCSRAELLEHSVAIQLVEVV